ncbi:MAG: hypothetical protein ACSLFM_02065 [Tepidiformaceae bacterium]
MTLPRPEPVGQYELLQDFEATGRASVRVFRLTDDVEIESHVHQMTTQIYVAITSRTIIERDGVATPIDPYQAVMVPPGTVHRAYPAGADAVIMNISVPPLRADDQVRVGPHA